MKIFLAGDSTMQYNDYTTYPQVGWGQVLPLFLKDEIIVRNFAKNGRSTKSFILENRLEEIKKEITKGDYLFIQFGHNDEKSDERGTKPFLDYQENLKKFIKVAEDALATPILLTSIYRRHFDNEGKIKDNVHLDYPKAMIELALKENVICLDICQKTKEIIASFGDQKSKSLFMHYPENTYLTNPKASSDDTHLRYDGAYLFTHLIVMELIEKLPEFALLLKESI